MPRDSGPTRAGRPRRAWAPLNLSSRIALVLCAVVVFAAGLPTAMILWRFNAQLIDAKLDDLEHGTRTMRPARADRPAQGIF